MHEMKTEMYFDLHCKYLLLLPDFNQNWYVLENFSKTAKYQIPWKSV
jgi:hypothetical protein